MSLVSRIVGTGSYLPARVVSNEEISTWVDTTDEWIRERSGICQRHFAAENEFTSDLAEQASLRALEAAGISGADLDLIVLATATPDNTFPATATKLQARLGMNGGFAFDVQAVCSGFLYALSVADSMVKTGQARNALVIAFSTGKTAAPVSCLATVPVPLSCPQVREGPTIPGSFRRHCGPTAGTMTCFMLMVVRPPIRKPAC